MTKILKKDIENICNCIQNISYEYIKENDLHCFNHNIISRYRIAPYNCKKVEFYFYKDNYKFELTADNKKDMYINLLELYKKGLNNWTESYEKDSYKTKRERYRLNGYKKKLIELNRVVDICYS